MKKIKVTVALGSISSALTDSMEQHSAAISFEVDENLLE